MRRSAKKIKGTHVKKQLYTYAIIALYFFTSTCGSFAIQAPAFAGPESVSGASAHTDGGNGSNGLITIDFSEVDIQTALKVLAMKGNVNIVSSPDVQGTVTINLKDVPWKSAFETILRINGLISERDGNIYEVFPKSALEEQRIEETRSEVITLEYATLDQVKTAIEKVLSPQGKIESIEGTNQIVIFDASSHLKRAGQLIEQIDRKMPQVLIEAKIVQTALGKGEELGVDWNAVFSFNGAKRPTTFPFSDNPAARRLGKFLQRFDQLPLGQTASESTVTGTSGGGTATATASDFPIAHGFPFVDKDEFKFGTLDFSNFGAVIRAIKSRSNTKIISSPRIVTLNHQEAVVQVGDEIGIPIFERNESTGSFEITGYEQRQTGVILTVTPHITDDQEIILTVKPEVTSFLGFVGIDAGTNLTSPQFRTIVASTNVLVHSTDTLVIGGLITDDEQDNFNKVPWLHRIPALGWFFKSISREAPNNRKSETIFFITVTLVDDVYNKQALAEWRQKEKEYKEFRAYTEEEYFQEHKGNKKEKEKKD